jgi:pyruvate dehydrogenase complex dehydrogenase (E1) component
MSVCRSNNFKDKDKEKDQDKVKIPNTKRKIQKMQTLDPKTKNKIVKQSSLNDLKNKRHSFAEFITDEQIRESLNFKNFELHESPSKKAFDNHEKSTFFIDVNDPHSNKDVIRESDIMFEILDSKRIKKGTNENESPK